MKYEFEITVPANTSYSDRLDEELKLDKGIITQATCYFPLGCMHLARFKCFHSQYQLAPFNREGYVSGEGTEVLFLKNYELLQRPYSLRIELWNVDDTYDHTLTFRILVEPSWLAIPQLQQSKLLSRIAKGITLMTTALTGEEIENANG
jgi:hypothetical protein